MATLSVSGAKNRVKCKMVDVKPNVNNDLLISLRLAYRHEIKYKRRK